MAAADNTVSGGLYVLYVRAKGAAKTENKLLMCQTDFTISQSSNTTESKTKCGTKLVVNEPTRTASISGELAMPATDSGTQTYVDIKQLQVMFDSGAEQSFTLMPKNSSATLSTGKLQEIDFDGKFTKYDQGYPTEGNATFSNDISMSGAPVYTDFIPV